MNTFKFEKLSRAEMKSIGGGTHSITVRCKGENGATLTSSTATIKEAQSYGAQYCGAKNFTIVCVGDC